MAAVAQAVGRAAEVRGWSLRRLAQEVGLTDKTLARWKTGEARSLDIEALAKIFDLAGMSMDESFGIGAGASTAGMTRQEVEEIIDERMGVRVVAQPAAAWSDSRAVLEQTLDAIEGLGEELRRSLHPDEKERKRDTG